jgi:hypothetical protein
MIYLYIDENRVKLLYLKKTILGQYETVFFEKKHEAQLLNKGKVISTDLLASAVKEALSLSSSKPITDKEVFLILQQDAFYFLRAEVPGDIAPSAVTPFVKDKARAVLPVDIENCIYDHFVQETDAQKILTFYALDRETVEQYQQALSLIDLKIFSILPDTLTYFKLFEKTLRREKKENIFYVSHEQDSLSGYLFDSYGLVGPTKWVAPDPNLKLETVLKEKAQEFEEKKSKLNRIILSGSLSENVRQDTFTKSVGVWTNPLKRIIPTFYQDYLKLLVMGGEKTFPILNLDACFGAFVFHQENKGFSMVKNGLKLRKSSRSFSLPKVSLPLKEIAMFAASFVLSLIFLLVISNLKLSLPSFSFKLPSRSVKPSITPKPTIVPSPTPSFQKESLKIKVLNGSGTPGKANEVKDILVKKGYQEVLTGNADNFDYEQSELQVKKSKSQAAGMIQNDFKDYVSSFKQTILGEEEAADAVVIIGTNFK